MIQYNKKTNKEININELIVKFNEKQIEFNKIKDMFKKGNISSKDLGLIISETIEKNTRNNPIETLPVKFSEYSLEEQCKSASTIYYYQGKDKCHIIQYLDRGKALVKFENSPGYREVWKSYLKPRPDHKYIQEQMNKLREEPDLLCDSCGELGKDINNCEYCNYPRD